MWHLVKALTIEVGLLMAIKRRIHNLSKLSRELLAEGESSRSDFKRLPDGISADDLVSFANSENGGNILAGIDEHSLEGAQVGIVRGCDVSDATVLQVLNKAVSCIPPVSINVYIENLDEKPILRVEVPSSSTKPHCTPKGVYSRRDGARNRPLHPSELLRLFLESEARAFSERFEVAAERITEELTKLESSLNKSISNMSDQLGWADYQLGDTESALQKIQALAAKLNQETANANSRLRSLFRQDKREDPVRSRARLQYVNKLINEILEDDALTAHVVAGGQLTVKSELSEDSDITEEDAKQLLEVATRHVRDRERDKMYNIIVTTPKSCTKEELDQFASKVAEGGEVAEGAGERVKRAFRLGFIVYNETIVGTAALKKPTENYRAKVFKNAKSGLNPSDYPYELGWIFLDVPHRKKGQMTRLIDDLLPAAQGSALFSTTRSSNEIMREMLVQLKFIEDGVEYQSTMNEEETLRLYVRSDS